VLSRVGSFVNENGGLTVAIISALSSTVLSLIPARPLRWMSVVTAPLAIALIIYWGPTWRRADAPEYSAWVLALVIPWYVGGVVASALVCLGVEKLRAHETDP
jgi:predicted membrane protein